MSPIIEEFRKKVLTLCNSIAKKNVDYYVLACSLSKISFDIQSDVTAKANLEFMETGIRESLGCPLVHHRNKPIYKHSRELIIMENELNRRKKDEIKTGKAKLLLCASRLAFRACVPWKKKMYKLDMSDKEKLMNAKMDIIWISDEEYEIQYRVEPNKELF